MRFVPQWVNLLKSFDVDSTKKKDGSIYYSCVGRKKLTEDEK